VCAIAPRAGAAWERMRPAPGQAVADGSATRDQRSTVDDPIEPWPIVCRGDQSHPFITLPALRGGTER
jgi:hypothetical protein